MRGEHFLIGSTRDVPRFLEAANDKLGGDEFEARVLDIEGCYPQMPKDKHSACDEAARAGCETRTAQRGQRTHSQQTAAVLVEGGWRQLPISEL